MLQIMVLQLMSLAAVLATLLIVVHKKLGEEKLKLLASRTGTKGMPMQAWKLAW